MEKKSIHAGHRERVRERFCQQGLDGFSEHEVLELLLFYGIPQRDVNPLAHALIDRFGSLAGVLDADVQSLTDVPGMGQKAAVLLHMIPQVMRRYERSLLGERPVITNLATAKAFCGTLFLGRHEECIYLICLNQKGEVLHAALMHTGTVDEVALYPRSLVETALRHHAFAVMLAHNHPSGVREPSQADYDTTIAVVKAMALVGVRVLDHLIYSGGEVHSMMSRSVNDGEQSEDFSYIIRSRNVPGQRGRLKEEQEWLCLSAGAEGLGVEMLAEETT